MHCVPVLLSRDSPATFKVSEAGSSRSDESAWATFEGQDTLTFCLFMLFGEVHSGTRNKRKSTVSTRATRTQAFHWYVLLLFLINAPSAVLV